MFTVPSWRSSFWGAGRAAGSRRSIGSRIARIGSSAGSCQREIVFVRESPVRERQCVYGVLSERDSVCVRERERVSPRMGGSRRSIGSRIARIGFSAGSCHLELLELRFRGCGVQGFVIRFLDSALCFQVSGFRFPGSTVSDPGSPVLAPVRGPVLRFRIQGLFVIRFLVSGLCFQVAGFRVQVSGFRFEVSGFWFQVAV